MINTDKSVALYKAIADANEERIYELWHASSMAMCPRAHYYKRLAIPETTEKPTGAKIIRWQAGHNLEAAIRPYIAEVYGGLASNERIISEKLKLTGEFDNLVLADNKLVEIKSVHDFAFIERDGQLALKDQVGVWTNTSKPRYGIKDTPYLGHELQNHAYVLLLAEQGKEVKEIDYVYISLGGRIVVYSTIVSEEYLENVKKRLEALNKAWNDRTPPSCICVKEHPLFDSVMRWCPYQQEGKKCCSLDLIKINEEMN